jgi:uncharacterized protein with HEPN domain
VPHRSWEFRILDIIEAIESVIEYTAEMTYDQFAHDRKTIDAVVRNFIIIGEAANNIPDELIQIHPDIPWREMRDMRNIIVHEYFGVDNLIVWDSLQKDLPPLLTNLKKMLED